MADAASEKSRIDALLTLIAQVAGGDLDARGEVSDAQDDIDALVVGMHILAEDFALERQRRAEADERLQAAYDLYYRAPLFLCSVDTETGWIMACNETFASFLSAEVPDVEGRPLRSVFHESSHAAFDQLWADLQRGEVTRDRQLHLDPTGTGNPAVPVRMSLTASREPGRHSASCILQDESAHVLLEARLRQAQKMEAVGRLAGGVAHDFNNALTIIQLCNDMVVKTLASDHPALPELAQIGEAASHAEAVTRGLLAFSRQQVVSLEPCDLNRAIQDSAPMIRTMLLEDIAIELHPSPGLWKCLFDHTQLRQVILNICINARDAMPFGGTLTLETSNTLIDEAYAREHYPVKPGEYVTLTISDDGAGMTPEVAEMVFEPFFTTKPLGQGTGLGLSTCFGLVKQAGGTIWVYSELGEGTSFSIHLPRLVDSVMEAPRTTERAPPLGGAETILLVEDQESVRRLVRIVLSRAGYVVLDATNGRHALEVREAHEGKVDLLFTDVVMPIMGGRELAARLLAQDPDLRVLYTSGYTANVIVQRGVLKHGLNHIQKPFSPTKLLATVRDVLDT